MSSFAGRIAVRKMTRNKIIKTCQQESIAPDCTELKRARLKIALDSNYLELKAGS